MLLLIHRKVFLNNIALSVKCQYAFFVQTHHNVLVARKIHSYIIRVTSYARLAEHIDD